MNLFSREIKELVEALLLCSAEPLSLKTLAEITGQEPGDLLEVLEGLRDEYAEQSRGFEIREIAGGWCFATFPRHASYIERLVKPRLSSLSPSAAEVLTIIAYRQPITRGELEDIRGVNSDSPVNTLLNRGLIREAGRKDVPGRPILFATTADFLKRFGLNSLGDLKPLAGGGGGGEAAKAVSDAGEAGEADDVSEIGEGDEADEVEAAGEAGEGAEAGEMTRE
ncbi:MAG: SMC-Scp complex subunit ScpB [Peptococcaceae bacterium]|jgi:segregation and condensation protein B|nr:SMC-Scp complex subunit ScpB [Peptococcaceae bacterium]